MPRPESSRKNLETARKKLAEMLAKGKGEAKDISTVYYPDEPKVDEDSSDDSESEDEVEEKPLAKKARKGEPTAQASPEPAKKPTKSKRKVLDEERIESMIRDTLNKHMTQTRADIRQTVASAGADLAISRVYLAK